MDSAASVASVGHVPWPEILIADALISPIRKKLAPGTIIKQADNLTQATQSLTCLDTSAPTAANPLGTDAYCFDTGTAILRLRKEAFIAATYPRVGLFQDRHVGVDMTIEVNREILVKLHVDTLATVPDMGSDAFSPMTPVTFTPDQPRDRTLVKPPVLLGAPGLDIPGALRGRIKAGRVVCRITIDKGGGVRDIHVLESPDVASADFVVKSLRQYRFKAAQAEGQPVATELTFLMNLHAQR